MLKPWVRVFHCKFCRDYIDNVESVRVESRSVTRTVVLRDFNMRTAWGLAPHFLRETSLRRLRVDSARPLQSLYKGQKPKTRMVDEGSMQDLIDEASRAIEQTLPGRGALRDA
jgi:hypothetical protein